MRAFKLLSLIIASLTLLPSFLLPNEAFADIKTLNGLSGQNQTFQNDSNITVSSANRVHTIGWTGLLPVSRGGTGTGSFTSGSLLFSNGTNITQNNSNLFWDDANNRLGIGTTSPTSTLSVNGSGSVSGNLNVTGTISASNFNPSNYVPYTGATGIVNLGAHNISVGSLSSTNDSIINSLNVGKGGGSIENNTSVGIGALQNNSNGDRNTALGSTSLNDNSVGNDNVAVGFRSLNKSVGSGGSNTAVGSQAFWLNLTGSGNVVMGSNAAVLQATDVALTTANQSIYIGNEVRGFDNNDDNSIVIGARAVGAGANKAVIGNSALTDVYLGSADANSNIHAKKLFLGSFSIPGCIIMGDSAGGVGYITLDNGALTASSTPPAACQ